MLGPMRSGADVSSGCAVQANESVWLLRSMARHRSLDAAVQPTGTLAAALEGLLSRQHLLEHELEAVRSSGKVGAIRSRMFGTVAANAERIGRLIRLQAATNAGVKINAQHVPRNPAA